MLSIDPVSEADRIAIIGMAGRFPGAATVDEFWDMIVAGREGLSRFDENELIEQGVASELVSHPDYVPAKGVLAEADRFDAGFFGISPREADLLDPQQRVFLECAWEALESAGHDPRAFPGRIGVFGGASLDSYLLFNLLGNPDVVNEFGMFQTQLANDKDFLATRVAYKMGLRGPAITTQTACSTSLVAVHLACQSLLSGECDMAIAGGVSINVPLKSGYLFEPGGIMSRDGHCRPFDADAGGTVAGNGVALVVLRRLEEARMDGDLVDAIILGSAINNDGSGKVGFTAPSVEGQAEVIAEALALADAPADSIGYIEAHGTGTPMGDPIEVAALTKVFRDQTDATGPCLLGSVKSNVGHLDAAAGVTGLIKASLALKHGVVPPTLHFSSPNPELRLETSPFVINNEAVAWQGQGSPRRAGVSSFGIGGTNAHVVLEQDRSPIVVGEDDGWHLLALSARTAEALARMADRMADHIEAHPEQSLSDIAHTLATRRHAFERRLAIACTRDNVCDRLRQAASSGRNETARAHPKVAFVFPGQGSQYIDMARGLYDDDPVFRRELDVCLNLFAQHVDRDLRDPVPRCGQGERDGAGDRADGVHPAPPVRRRVRARAHPDVAGHRRLCGGWAQHRRVCGCVPRRGLHPGAGYRGGRRSRTAHAADASWHDARRFPSGAGPGRAPGARGVHRRDQLTAAVRGQRTHRCRGAARSQAGCREHRMPEAAHLACLPLVAGGGRGRAVHRARGVHGTVRADDPVVFQSHRDVGHRRPGHQRRLLGISSTAGRSLRRQSVGAALGARHDPRRGGSGRVDDELRPGQRRLDRLARGDRHAALCA